MEISRLQWALWIILGGFILSFWGLYNGFPFVYPDTGAYIGSGFQGIPPIDRPICYGLFIRHLSMAESLFWVMYAQGLLTSLAVFLLLRHFVDDYTPVLFIGLLLVLTACTHISFYTSYLIPDLFTPIFWACIAILLFGKPSTRASILITGLAWVSMIMHNSILISGLALSLLLVLAILWKRVRVVISPKKVIHIGALVLGSWLSVMSIHYAHNGKFVVQQAAHIFTMARLNEMGLLQPYLQTACAAGDNYTICQYKDQLPGDFLWHPDSPAGKDGGWLAHKTEYENIIWNILTTPKYLKSYVIEVANGTLSQLCYFRIEDIGPMRENTPPYETVKQYFPRELYSYKVAHQQHRNHFLDFSGLNTRQQYLFFGYLLLLVAMFSGKLRHEIPLRLKQLLIFCAVMLLINASVCSTFSTVASRFQGRLVWLAVAAELFVLLWLAMQWKKKIRF